jgi:glycosyltransferase involved in cell wall biosynthesis
MHIAIVGTRGIPARYGGFETFAEELGKRLSARGHRVTVYGRERHTSATCFGCDLIHLPTIRQKYLDTVVHTFLSTIHLLFRRADAALYCNSANAIFTWMPRLAGIPVALNVDGLERNRRKWNRLGQLWYLSSERWSTWFPNAVVSDANRIRAYYWERYRIESEFIPYGADMERLESRATLDRLGLEPGRYFLYVSRMEPENNALLVRESFERAGGDMKLALIGDAPYAADYIAQVRSTRDPRVVIPGAIYGDGYRELGSHCFAYIHATEVGGTHPALIENMGRGALTLYLDTPENAEVASGAGIPFTAETLVGRLHEVQAMSERERKDWGERARRRIEERYSWEAVTDAYEALLRRLAG